MDFMHYRYWTQWFTVHFGTNNTTSLNTVPLSHERRNLLFCRLITRLRVGNTVFSPLFHLIILLQNTGTVVLCGCVGGSDPGNFGYWYLDDSCQRGGSET
jgi:hypothetical protein